MHQVFRSTFFNFEFIRILSTAPFGGADIAECLQAASDIKNNDPESWKQAWTKQAHKAAGLAKTALLSGDKFSARRAYLRASNYYRASVYMYCDRSHHDVTEGMNENAVLFKCAAGLLDARASSHKIPYHGNHTLPAYLYLPPQELQLPGRKTPVLINTGGADSIQEELYYIYGSTGPSLGYAVLTFDGPGQGSVARKQGLRMRGDWEFVVGRVLDYVEELSKEQPELNLDVDRIGIAGASMGGYFALRGASDPRIKACVAIDPFYDMFDFATQHVSPAMINGWKSGWISPVVLDAMIRLGMKLSFQTKWEILLTAWLFGVKSPSDILLAMQKFTLKLPGSKEGESFLKFVNCPVLVSGAAKSLYLEPGKDAAAIMQGLKHLSEQQKRLWLAHEPEDGGLQAKVGALGLSAQRTFQFLDEHFEIDRTTPSTLSLLS